MAGRSINKLTDLAIRKAKAPGWYGDGGGLYLRVEAPAKAEPGAVGPKRWIFVYQWHRKRAEMGLGSLADVSLAEARDERGAARSHVRAGRNPAEERRREREASELVVEIPTTFGDWAEEVAPAIGPKAAKARKAWVAMMKEKTGDLAQLAPAAIETEDVLRALKPYWISRPESGRRMRQRIEKVLDAAKSKGLIADRHWQNPARLKGHLDNLLERRAIRVKHRLALPYVELPGFLAQLRAVDSIPARALELTILTSVRNVEARGARLREFDRKRKLWTIPAERMKGVDGFKREHRVPLSDAAVELLDAIWPGTDAPADALLFPWELSRTGTLSENALQNVVIALGLKGRATVHGFRSSFRDWAGDMTNFQRETIETALAHKLEDDTEAAYRRSDALLKRAKLMEAWARYLARPAAAGDNVRQLGRVGG
jgi:integrase